MARAVKILTASDLRPGVSFRYSGHPVEILREAERRKDQFGRDLESWWARRLDTGDEGYVSLGPGGVLRVEPLKASPKRSSGLRAGGSQQRSPGHRSGMLTTMANPDCAIEYEVSWYLTSLKTVRSVRFPTRQSAREFRKKWPTAALRPVVVCNDKVVKRGKRAFGAAARR